MPADPLAALADRFGLDEAATARLARYADWLDTDAAPSTLRGGQIVEGHLADSLVALEACPWLGADGTRIADIGSGAGLPGLALACARPGLRVTLVESVGKKCAFLREVVAELELDVDVVTARAEEWREGIGRCDAVVCRALAPLPVLAEYAAPLLAPGGRLVAWKGAVPEEEAAAADGAASVLGLEWDAPQRVEPFAGAERRTLWVATKTGPTPERFPRRAGMARKRPLG